MDADMERTEDGDGDTGLDSSASASHAREWGAFSGVCARTTLSLSMSWTWEAGHEEHHRFLDVGLFALQAELSVLHSRHKHLLSTSEEEDDGEMDFVDRFGDRTAGIECLDYVSGENTESLDGAIHHSGLPQPEEAEEEEEDTEHSENDPTSSLHDSERKEIAEVLRDKLTIQLPLLPVPENPRKQSVRYYFVLSGFDGGILKNVSSMNLRFTVRAKKTVEEYSFELPVDDFHTGLLFATLEKTSDGKRFDVKIVRDPIPGRNVEQCTRSVRHIFSENLREGVSLSRRTIQEGLSKISAIDDGINYGYSDLFMQKRNVRDLNGIENFSTLQSIDVSGNELDSIIVLSKLPLLRFLSAKNNFIQYSDQLFHSKFLQKVDLSENLIRSFQGDFLAPHLTSLNLSDNFISFVQFRGFPQLMEMDLSSNFLCSIPRMEAPLLRVLNLSNNEISSIEGADQFPRLRRLDLSRNMINTLRGQSRFPPTLQVLNLDRTHLSKVEDFGCLLHLQELEVLSVQDLASDTDFSREQILSFLVDPVDDNGPVTLNLRELDGEVIEEEERNQARETAFIRWKEYLEELERKAEEEEEEKRRMQEEEEERRIRETDEEERNSDDDDDERE